MTITPEQLKAIAPTLKMPRAQLMAALPNEIAPDYPMTDEAYKMFLANVIQESGEFSHKVEVMNYSAQRLVQVWPTRFNGETAPQYAHNPVKLANKVYGFRMGNTGPNDGWLFRGGGFIGLTGREVYAKYAAHLGKPVETTASIVQNQDHYALDSAFWFFRDLKGLHKLTDFRTVVKGINGGLIGYEVRRKYYDKVREVLG